MTKAHDPVTPGEILLTEFLEPLGITQYRLAQAIGVPQTRISEIVHGKRAITTETALRLSKALGVDDRNMLDIVLWHHDPDAAAAGEKLQARNLLRVADIFVAKLAARKTRLAMSPLGAAKSMVIDASGNAPVLASALATAVGFYPPGTYVQLVNGEKAVVVARGARVAPVVVEIATVLNSAVDDETAIEPIYTPVSAPGEADKAIASMPTVEVVDGVTVGFKKLDSMTTNAIVKEEAVLVLWRRNDHLLGFVVRKKRSIDLAALIKETPRLMKLFESSLD